ncbi:hypothetical protein MASR1M66_22490 [Aminivibrio sp.]
MLPALEELWNYPWATFWRALRQAGAGEVLLNSVDRDGTMNGMDMI